MRLDITLPIALLLSLLSIQILAQDSDTVRKATRSFFEKGNITGSLSYQSGRISDFNKNADGSLNFSEPVFKLRSSLALAAGIRLFELVYLRTTFYAHLNPNINAPWVLPDYAYVLERTCYDDNSFSYGYVNYGVNKYSDNGKAFLENFQRGTFYVRYFNSIPQSWKKRIGLNSTSLNYFLEAKYAAKYLNNQNKAEGDWLHGKPVLSAGLRYTFFQYIYLEGAINYYLAAHNKMRWDPDFTYAFGFNKYAHMTIGFSYGNYSSNRLPWNEKQIKDYGFLDGVFSVLLNIRF